MYSCALFLFNVLLKYGDASSEAHYECGPHGKFEYCIDGIPGCIVGCHCHPGYYFDTESKICEPNIKLAHDYRRHYYLEPTRLPSPSYNPLPTPTSTTADPIEVKVDAIAQDTDDIGDWLYNQFFKTIENQVINKTEGEPLTRRSGGAAQPIPKRRYHKKGRKKSKRKKLRQRFKKKGLRKKLLRITEDDSLFDSSSNSEETSSSDSDTDSDIDTYEDSHGDDKEHGHRKILMFNRKGTSPLPSFVFLPNIETPFYPPIGLPAPPVPMYPMVPVPPYIAYPQKCKNDTTTSAPGTTAPPGGTTEPPTSATTAAAEPAGEPEQAPEQEPAADGDATRTKANNNKHLTLRKHGQRDKIMRLRNKMKKMNRQPFLEQFGNKFQDPETPYFNDHDPPPPMQFRSQPHMFDNPPPMEDVDFKYLSQLIHKMDLDKNKPNIPFKPNQNVPIPNAALPMRRSYQSIPMTPEIIQTHKLVRPASKADDMNETFYSNLGKQIATLIRKVDTNGEREINIEIEKENIQSPMQTVFNENSPRSYWERFVRSPLKYKQTYHHDNKNSKHSSERLFNLEDQVNVATAIERTLSLHELETMANIINQAQSKIPKVKQFKKPPNTVMSKGFDINLWPSLRRRNDIKTKIKANNNNNKVIKKKNLQRTVERNVDDMRRNDVPKKIVLTARIYNNHNTTKLNQNGTKNISRQEFFKKLLNSQLITPLHHQVSRIVHANVTVPKQTDAQRLKYQLSPMMLNYKSFKYVTNNHKQYRSQHSLIPFPHQIFSHQTLKTTGNHIRPSYFHHEFHHLDYFD